MTNYPQPGQALFSGDWEYDTDLECYDTAYQAVRFGQSWNGFATPVVTRNVLVGFAARQQMLSAGGEYVDIIREDGNGFVLVREDADDDEEPTWLLPDEDGNFDLGLLGWTFLELDSEDDRIVRIIPSEVSR